MGRKVECIQRLIEINHSYEEICDWLILNKFTNFISVGEFTRPKEKAEFIYEILREQEKEENIILLYFEWSILPKESIKITCTTKNEEKYFSYGW